MGSKKLSWISFVLSTLALVVGVIALVNRCPTQDLYSHFDYIGVIVGILALLVTALIGAQVGQYVFVDKKIEGISKRITRIIAKKVAAEVAQRETPELAKQTALEAIDDIVSDFSQVMISQDLLYKAKNYRTFSEFMKTIDNGFEALAILVQCKNNKMSDPSVMDALRCISDACERCRESGGARILEGRRDYYKEVLQKITQDTNQIEIYLNEAKGMSPDTDDKIRENEVLGEFSV